MEEEATKAVEQLLSLFPFLVALVTLTSIFIIVSSIRGKRKEEEKEESTKDEVGTMADEIRKLQRQKR